MSEGHYTLRGHKETKFDDDLGVLLGVPAAIILGKVHMWLNRDCTKDNIFEGRRWVYNPYKRSDKKKEQGIRVGHSWEENFPFYSLNTIKRAFNKLESLGILLSGEFNKLDGDRTKWYTVDYSRLEELLPYTKPTGPPLSEGDTPSTQNGSVGKPTPTPSTQNGSVGKPKMGRSLPVPTKTVDTEKSQPSVDPSLKSERDLSPSFLKEGLELRLNHLGEPEGSEWGPKVLDVIDSIELFARRAFEEDLKGLLPPNAYKEVAVYLFDEQITYCRTHRIFGKNVAPMLTKYLRNRWVKFQGSDYFVYDYYSLVFGRIFDIHTRTTDRRTIREIYAKVQDMHEEGLDIQEYLNWLHTLVIKKGMIMGSLKTALTDAWTQGYRNKDAPTAFATMDQMLER